MRKIYSVNIWRYFVLKEADPILQMANKENGKFYISAI